jgi:hypothetical protein
MTSRCALSLSEGSARIDRSTVFARDCCNPYSISARPLRTAKIARLRLSAESPAPGTISTRAPATIPSRDKIAGIHRTVTRSPNAIAVRSRSALMAMTQMASMYSSAVEALSGRSNAMAPTARLVTP